MVGRDAELAEDRRLEVVSASLVDSSVGSLTDSSSVGNGETGD